VVGGGERNIVGCAKITVSREERWRISRSSDSEGAEPAKMERIFNMDERGLKNQGTEGAISWSKKLWWRNEVSTH